jgi:hypothetical protein
VRLSRCEVRDHINYRKNDRWRSHRFYRALQRLKSPMRYICEIFGVPQFLSFSTQSTGDQTSSEPKRPREPAEANLRGQVFFRLGGLEAERAGSNSGADIVAAVIKLRSQALRSDPVLPSRGPSSMGSAQLSNPSAALRLPSQRRIS